MSTLEVTAEELTIHPHPNADALELAQVGLFRAVVAKGQFVTGDVAVYIPEQSVLPDGLIDELGLTGRLAGPAKNRVKAVRLRGEVSQGLVCRPLALAGVDLLAERGVNFADRLGIVKYVPEVPASMSGEVVAAPDLLPWVEIENVKRFPDVFAPGEPVTATEKIHGTCCLVTAVRATGETLVSSKGHGERHFALKESNANLYWRAVRAHGVAEFAHALAGRLDAERVGVFGEVFGPGVQDLGYGRPGRGDVGYRVFDVSVPEPSGTVRWLTQDELVAALDGSGLEPAPRLYEGPYVEDVLLALASGPEQVSGTEANLREGVVVRPAGERDSPQLGGRAIVKVVSDAYLLRKGGTEYA